MTKGFSAEYSRFRYLLQHKAQHKGQDRLQPPSRSTPRADVGPEATSSACAMLMLQ